MALENDVLSFLLSLDKAKLLETLVLPELTITQHPGGLRLTHQIQGGQVEAEHSPDGKGNSVITIRLDNVFGDSRTLYISQDTVQVDDRVYEFKKTVARLAKQQG